MSEQKFISKYTSTEIEAMLDKVKQDMQNIQYTQSEINTLLGKIQNMTQPTKTSDLNNDSGFITNSALSNFVTSDTLNNYATNNALNNKQSKTLESPLTIGNTEQTTVEGALAALNSNSGNGSNSVIDSNNYINMGFTPIGTIISVMGNSAPTNYLVCDGTSYNISDYPELAAYFETQFGTKNYFGGNGTTTFNVPDLRGEFLRGTGTNSHKKQGSGAAVGTHQDSELPNISGYVSDTPFASANGAFECTNSTQFRPPFNNNAGDSWFRQLHMSGSKSSSVYKDNGEARPTNTSVLYCIATKNIYIDVRFDYSTTEKVVGTWIDGKPLYQKTISFGALPNTTDKSINHNISNVNKVINISGYSLSPSTNTSIDLNTANTYWSVCTYADRSKIYILTNSNLSAHTETYVTLQYTKTT